MTHHKFAQYAKYIVINIIIAAFVATLLMTYVASAYRIKGDSMYPVLKNRERVIIYKLGVKQGDISRFDILVIHKPSEPSKSIIKRAIGLPGEFIESKEGEIYINYKKLKQPFLKEDTDYDNNGIFIKPLLIPEGHYFVLGDNRPVSRDSRSFGTVNAKYIYGKTFLRYWPLSQLGKIQ
ncbi:MAG: signal peptidase I [bacterium]|nr:signal peptidase I [bacterium]